jgi:hypothetical protein
VDDWHSSTIFGLNIDAFKPIYMEKKEAKFKTKD